MKYPLIICTFLFICSCNYGRQENDVKQADSIFMLYYVTNVETSIRLTKENISHQAERTEIEDVIPLDEKDFDQIKKLIITCHSDSINQKYDARIHLRIDTFQMCLPYNDNILSQKDIIYQDFKTVYLLKWKSGFYNTIPKDELKNQNLLKKFGIPQDYHFVSYESSAPPFKLVHKVAFVQSKVGSRIKGTGF